MTARRSRRRSFQRNWSFAVRQKSHFSTSGLRRKQIVSRFSVGMKTVSTISLGLHQISPCSVRDTYFDSTVKTDAALIPASFSRSKARQIGHFIERMQTSPMKPAKDL